MNKQQIIEAMAKGIYDTPLHGMPMKDCSACAEAAYDALPQDIRKQVDEK